MTRLLKEIKWLITSEVKHFVYRIHWRLIRRQNACDNCRQNKRYTDSKGVLKFYHPVIAMCISCTYHWTVAVLRFSNVGIAPLYRSDIIGKIKAIQKAHRRRKHQSS